MVNQIGQNLLLIYNDANTKDLKQAINEGYDRIEHLKRYTKTVGTDQVK